jgi:hypothetical protein
MFTSDDPLGKQIVVLFTEDNGVINEKSGKCLSDFLQKVKMTTESPVVFYKDMTFENISDRIDDIVLIIHPENEPSANLKALIANIRNQSRKILVALHEDQSVQIKNIQMSLGDISTEYMHVFGNESIVWDSFSKICFAIETKNANEFIDNYLAIIDGIQRSVPKLFSILKHRIAHLFLSMDVDFQGIDEIKSKPAKALEYLKAVLESHKNDSNYYQAKIKKLKEYVKEGKKSILQVLDDNVSRSDIDLTLLLTLCGLNDEQENHIKGYVDKLDKMLTKDSLDEKDIKIVIEPFGESGWNLKGAEPSKIKSFHDWFSVLMNVLEKLQKKLNQK